MRIALLNTIRAYGGGEKRVMQGAAEYEALGHAVLVVGDPRGELVRRRAASGGDWAAPELGRYWSFASARRLARVLGRYRADVVVCYDQRSVRLAALADRLVWPHAPWPGQRFPSIIYYYGGEGTFRNRFWNQRVVGPRIARYVPNAEALRQELLSFGWIPDTHVQVIYDGLDPTPILQADPTGMRRELDTPPDALVAITVARLVPGKGHEILLHAVQTLAPRYPQLRIWLAGDGPEDAAYRALAARLGVADRVQFLGFRKDVPRLLRAADLLCHPSRKEGAPNAVREGMAAGLPVAAVAASGTPELMVEGETGLLSPVDDVPALAANLDRLLADPDLRKRMGSAGKERALAEFAEGACTLRWLNLFEACRAERGDSSPREERHLE